MKSVTIKTASEPKLHADHPENGVNIPRRNTDGLDVSFVRGDVAVFFLDDTEDTACMGAVVSVPLADIKDPLSDKAIEYFPSLKHCGATQILPTNGARSPRRGPVLPLFALLANKATPGLFPW